MLLSLYLIFYKNENIINYNFSSIYECGFINITFSRFFFSINMFIYLILFIVLDIEIFFLRLIVFYEIRFLIILNTFIFSIVLLIIYEWFSIRLNWFIK